MTKKYLLTYLLNENFIRKNNKVKHMKHILLKFIILTQYVQMECVTESNIFAFGIPPIKVIAPIGKHSDRTTECEKVLGCI